FQAEDGIRAFHVTGVQTCALPISCERFGLPGPVERWRALREEIRADILTNGYDTERNTFVQHYGGRALDAALLLIPQVGFLSANDRRFVGAGEAIERAPVEGSFVLRYYTANVDDGPH